MAALFQFPSEALIAAITSRRASEENAPSVFVSSQMCTPSDKLLTAAFSPNMMVIRQRVFSTAMALASAPVKRFQMCTKTSAFLRRMEGVCVCVCVCVCLLCVEDCKHDSPQGSDQISTAVRKGGGAGFFTPVKEELQGNRSLSSALRWAVRAQPFSMGECEPGLYMVG